MIKRIRNLLKLKNVLLVGGGVALLLVGFNLIKSATAPLAVESALVQRGNISQLVSVSGYLKPERKADLSFGVTNSRVVWLKTKIGNTVATGSALLSLDQTLLLNDVAAAEAALAQAKAAYSSAKSGEVIAHETYNNIRYQDSDRIEALKNQAYEAARSADDGVTAAEAAVASAKNNLARNVLTAPISGTVTIQKAIVGEIPTANPLVQIVDLNSLYFEVLIDELDVSKVKIGQKAFIKLNANKEQELEGVVDFIALTTTKDANNNVAVETIIKVTNAKNVTLRPGLEGDAQIVTEERKGALLVPFEAIVEEGQQKFALEINNKTKTVTRVAVTIGLEGERDTEITTGLSDGTLVVLNPAKTLKDKQTVTVK